MHRRTLLQVGVVSTALLAVAGLGLGLAPPAWTSPRLSTDARSLFEAIARAVLDGLLPREAGPHAAALKAHVLRVEQTIEGFPKPVQDELNLLLRMLVSTPGRVGLAGLVSPWSTASTPTIQSALQALRVSSIDLRQQTYQALRDITYAAYFSDPATWADLGYAGPIPLSPP